MYRVKWDREHIQLKAYDSLLKYNISSLPIQIPASTQRLRLFSLQFLAEYHHENADSYMEKCGEYGFIIYQEKFKRYVIFYNEEQSEETNRWVISIGISYIELGYFDPAKLNCIDIEDRRLQEFAYLFSCPDLILEACRIGSLDQIVTKCKIPLKYAAEKKKGLGQAVNIADLGLGQALMNQFSGFIRRFTM